MLGSLENVIYGTDEDLNKKIGEDYISRFRLIPFSSLGKQNGMLIGFKPDKAIIRFEGMEIEKNNVIIRNI